MNLEGIEGGDKLCLNWEMEDLSIHVIHSRKLNIKAIVTFYAAVDETTGIQIPVALEEEDISVKKKKYIAGNRMFRYRKNRYIVRKNDNL